MDSTAKIRVKVGSMEIEYEGDPAFLDGGIETLLVAMGELATRVPNESDPKVAQQSVDANGDNATPLSGEFNFSTNTIAAHLDAKTGPELAICAIAHLELVKGNGSSIRSEILGEMKNATTYYSTSMSSNMTKNLANLTKAKRINQTAKDTYSLSASERKQIEVKVADIG